MFEQIKEHHWVHVQNLERAYTRSKSLGLYPGRLVYRSFTNRDFKQLSQIVDDIRSELDYDYISGAGLLIHSRLKQEFASYGYFSEVVFGDVLVNGTSFTQCNVEALKTLLRGRMSYNQQKIHCWLLLANGQFFDATLFRSITKGAYTAEIHGFDYCTLGTYIFDYKPMLMGTEFIARMHSIPQLYL